MGKWGVQLGLYKIINAFYVKYINIFKPKTVVSFWGTRPRPILGLCHAPPLGESQNP